MNSNGYLTLLIQSIDAQTIHRTNFVLNFPFIIRRSTTLDCVKWILEQEAEGNMSGLKPLFQDAATKTIHTVHAIARSFHRHKKDVYKLHKNMCLDEEQLTTLAALTKSMAKLNGGFSRANLAELIGDITGNTPSRNTVHLLTKKFPEFFGVHKVKASSVARTDRVRVTSAIADYVKAAADVFKKHYPKHAVIATDQYLISKTKGNMFNLDLICRLC